MLLRNPDFSGRGAGGKAVVPLRITGMSFRRVRVNTSVMYLGLFRKDSQGMTRYMRKMPQFL